MLTRTFLRDQTAYGLFSDNSNHISISIQVTYGRSRGLRVHIQAREQTTWKRIYCVCKYVQSNDQWNCSILLPISISPFPWLPHSTLTFIQALIPGQPFPRSTNIPFSGPTIPPYGHLISCHPFPLTKCWVCKLCNKLFLSENKGTCQPDTNQASRKLSSLSVQCSPLSQT